jgi:putative ABC transport system substrate-binding protein
VKRRELVLAGAFAALCARRIGAQPRVARIGVLGNVGQNQSPTYPHVAKRLAELGYINGSTAVIEYRSSGGVAERVTQQVRELLGMNLDLIITMGPIVPVHALIAAKARVPIVFCAVDYDPVESGIVASYRRPGGNYTGAYIPQPALGIKRFELARELLPSARRFLVFYDPFSKDQLAAVSQTAAKTRASVLPVELTAPPYDYITGFKQAREAGMQALVGLMSPVFYQDRSQIADLALKNRLPAIGGANSFADAGFLASYGAPLAKVAEQTADIAVRILKGAKPADTPVEQVKEFEFAVNLKTAKALGIAIPHSMLLRSDKVIE